MKLQNQKCWMRWIAAAAISGVFLLIQSGQAEQAKQQPNTYDLRPRRQVGQTDRVSLKLEVEGLLVVSEDPKHAKPKMKVTGQNLYDERLLAVDPKTGWPTRSVRYYQNAEATIQIEQETVRPQLRPERRWIIAETQENQIHLFSPKGPLTREELDVVDLLGNSLLLDRLLPAEPVGPTSSWKPSEQSLAMLLGLEKISRSDVQCKWHSATERSILVEMAGTVQGQTGGGQSAMVLKGKYRVDRTTGRINWFGLALAERRTPGLVLRGVDVVVKLTVEITPSAQPPELSEQTLQDLSLESNAEQLLLMYQPPGKGWQILHPRSWHVQREENQTAVLSLFDQQQWVAQGTISLLPPLPKDQQISLEQFQQEIQQALGKNFGQFLQAGQYPTPEDLRMYRVVVEGKVIGQVQNKPLEVPMRWHYYRVADAQGRQAVFAFSLEPEQQERLGQADRAIVESFRFLEPADTPLQPTPAPSASESAKPAAPKPPQ
ncbi:MAG: hypothetical protein NZ602_16075 [Thermoguttaceae bacterium]|nr:hypothetical protein [Thermoguttaceae bacterium]MDW8038060.1 hypothetical protein [Thermoguttaceae bacterium]